MANEKWCSTHIEYDHCWHYGQASKSNTAAAAQSQGGSTSMKFAQEIKVSCVCPVCGKEAEVKWATHTLSNMSPSGAQVTILNARPAGWANDYCDECDNAVKATLAARKPPTTVFEG